MMFYKTKENGKMSFQTEFADNLTIGEIYRAQYGIEKWSYKGKENAYLKETVVPGKLAVLMTKPDGDKPFAVATNDCVRDGFEPTVLSKILIENGNYLVYVYSRLNDEEYAPLNIAIFKVTNINPEDDVIQTIEVKLEYKFNTLENFPVKFSRVVSHAKKVMLSNLDDQLLPKYCFNPNRTITMRLFVRNSKGELESYNDDGSRLIINRRSEERMDDFGFVESGIYRVFYSRKYENTGRIIVDGKRLTPLRDWELDDYIANSQLEEPMIDSIIKEIVVANGKRYIVITNLDGELRIVYKSVNGYSSFSLNEYEASFIESVEDIKELV